MILIQIHILKLRLFALFSDPENIGQRGAAIGQCNPGPFPVRCRLSHSNTV